MAHIIKIRYSSDSPETVSDVLGILESVLPYMLDNVHVYVATDDTERDNGRWNRAVTDGPPATTYHAEG